MHMAHLSGNTSGVSKSSSDWLNYTGFPGDACVAFFNVPPGNKDVTPGLNASLFIIGVHETGLCENCGEKETVEHVIYDCKRYDEERKELISYLNERGKVNKDLEYLLGYDFNRDRVG